MKKGIIVLGAAFLLNVTPVIPSANITEPKDSFIMSEWTLYPQASVVVHLDSEPKKIVVPAAKPSTPVKTLVNSSTVGWRVAKASQYGGSDGFYYHHFACGGKYLPSVVGVAHKYLPCGTKVTFKYYGTKRINGRSVKGWYTSTIRVVDRGPYCCGRSFDFTTQGAKSLGFYGIGTVYWKIAR